MLGKSVLPVFAFGRGAWKLQELLETEVCSRLFGYDVSSGPAFSHAHHIAKHFAISF